MTNWTPELLSRWTYPRDYGGETWYEYYGSGVGQSRDSDVLERANFESMRRLLGIENDNDIETRMVVRENHWAVGWVEWLAIHESDIEGLKIADEALQALEDYPILDECLYSELETEECDEVWNNCYDHRARLGYLVEHCSRNTLTYYTTRKAVSGCWYSACQLLPCPSEILY